MAVQQIADGASGAHASREITVRVAAKTRESATVVSLDLVPEGSPNLPAWQPGAHVDLVLADGLIRQYSLCGDPADIGRWRIAVLREPASRGGSAHVHDSLQVGDRLRVRGPRNNFPLVPAPRYLFVGGGIGITPLLPMIAQVETGSAPWELVYGGRSRESMAFLAELSRYGKRVSVRPEDEFGLLDVAGIVSTAGDDTAIYCCGPSPLITALDAACAACGRQAYSERFSGGDVPETRDDAGFELVLSRSGRVLHVPPNQTVVEVLRDAGIEVETSCEEGVCGTCEVSVLSGAIDHRDHILTARARARGDVMFVCVSRCLDDRLELDL